MKQKKKNRFHMLPTFDPQSQKLLTRHSSSDTSVAEKKYNLKQKYVIFTSIQTASAKFYRHTRQF